jgi:hypothetical protein
MRTAWPWFRLFLFQKGLDIKKGNSDVFYFEANPTSLMLLNAFKLVPRSLINESFIEAAC